MSAPVRKTANHPVFAAIEAHRRAVKRLDLARAETDEVRAESEGRRVTRADEAAYDRALAAEQAAIERIAETTPTTLAGVRAVLKYMRDRESREMWEEATRETLLTSLLASPALPPDPASQAGSRALRSRALSNTAL